jgi:F-type H+-transporting ATPase subunit b
MKLFDWFTVLAQIVNFVVLILLLKHFLYGRILRAIDSRESAIKARIAGAEETAHQAALQKEEYQKKLSAMEAARDEMLAEAQRDADRKRLELIEKAREEISSLEARWRADLERERAALFQDVRGRAAGEILYVVRRALRDLACCDLDQCAARVFLNKIGSMESSAWKELAGAQLVVLSASDLPDEVRKTIEETLKAHAINPVSVRFETAESLGWGLELRANGCKVAWSAEGYVDALEERLRDALAKKTGEFVRTVAA